MSWVKPSVFIAGISCSSVSRHWQGLYASPQERKKWQDRSRMTRCSSTVKNAYPLPLITELLDKLKGAKFFTKLDVWWGYNNIRIRDGDQWKAAFKTNRGLFEPTVMFFGLCNSLATFQAMMDDIFGDIINEGIIIVYMDDIFIFAPDKVTQRTLEGSWNNYKRTIYFWNRRNASSTKQK